MISNIRSKTDEKEFPGKIGMILIGLAICGLTFWFGKDYATELYEWVHLSISGIETKGIVYKSVEDSMGDFDILYISFAHQGKSYSFKEDESHSWKYGYIDVVFDSENPDIAMVPRNFFDMIDEMIAAILFCVFFLIGLLLFIGGIFHSP